MHYCSASCASAASVLGHGPSTALVLFKYSPSAVRVQFTYAVLKPARSAPAFSAALFARARP
eukprot:1188562-Lingulodinium_polyedra.AAC.1